MSSLRNAVKRITHKERSQPRARAHLGILEKKKDYGARAKDYHKKEDRLNALREKASMRNPDEFAFGMHRSQVDSATGKHRKTLQAQQKEFAEQVGGMDTIRLMKDQDLAYVRMQKQKDAKKIEKLSASLHFLKEDDDDEDAGTSSSKKKKKRKHTVFVDSKKEADEFDAAKHFDTLPELVGRSFNRPRKEQLKRSAKTLLAGGAAAAAKSEDYHDDDDQEEAVATAPPTAEDLKWEARQARKVARKLARARNASYGELEARSKRLGVIQNAEAHLVTEKMLAGKGRKRKIQAAENGKPALYKWRRKRLR